MSVPRLFLQDIGELLSVVVADDEAGGLFHDRPGRREATFGHTHHCTVSVIGDLRGTTLAPNANGPEKK